MAVDGNHDAVTAGLGSPPKTSISWHAVTLMPSPALLSENGPLILWSPTPPLVLC
jgi:hypothetical protein